MALHYRDSIGLFSPPPEQFEIGRHTFIDNGPPFDFYEIFIVRPAANGASIERITLTPAGDECIAPAKLETASASIHESVAMLLGSTNPCEIPKKALRHELRRRKGLVFSGANIAMQVQCGTQVRLIRSDILGGEMFGVSTNTPKYTSWTMQLLERIDHAVGPGALDEPIFPMLQEPGPQAMFADQAALHDLSTGKYDTLFPDAPDKPSDLFRETQHPLPAPTVQLQSSVPVRPTLFVQPDYPPLARMARIEGPVSFTIGIRADGTATNLTIEEGHPLLRPAIMKAVRGWKFPKTAANQEVSVTIEFRLNCPPLAP